MKQCTKCKEWKAESEFNKDKSKKDGLTSHCKKCVSKKDQNYYENHKEEKCQYQRDYKYSPLEYNSKTRQKLEWYEEVRQSINSNVEVKCAYDGDWFEPTKQQIGNRLTAINGKFGNGPESRLYCSNKCKEKCPIFSQIWHERGYQPATSREVQPELRKMVFARDNYTCQKCGYHRDELNTGIECHHMEGVQQNPIESADMDICITLCEDHHKEAHSEPGCSYQDLKCL